MIVLDASVLIAHLESTDAHHRRATQLLLNAADEQLAASPLTLAEVLVGPAHLNRIDRVEAVLRDLELTTVALSEDAPARLASLRASTRLRLPDCGVLLAAESTGACIATFDDRLAAAATTLGLDVRTA